MHLEHKLEELGKQLSEKLGGAVVGCRMAEGMPSVFLSQDPHPEMPEKIGGVDINYQNVGYFGGDRTP